jgi:hypothetical protein
MYPFSVISRKKWLLSSLLTLLLIGFIPVIDKALPVVRAKESFRSLFREDRFQAKMDHEAPTWMKKQLESDFEEFQERHITKDALDATYRRICEDSRSPERFARYRIIDNKLYKHVPRGGHFSATDTDWEKAFKTLLIYAKVPNIDFILCLMDGIPETYIDPELFLVEKEELQAPILAQAKRKIEKTSCVVLIPDQATLHPGWISDAKEVLALNEEISWKEKRERAVWRGSSTDIGLASEMCRENSDFISYPRFKICQESLKYPGLIDAGYGWVFPQLKAQAEEKGVMKGGLSKRDHLTSKYLPVLDGHMCTYTGYQWRLLSNSVSFKQESDQIQWFYSALKPYVHYVPIQNDMSDLKVKVEWAKNHDQLMQAIAKKSQEFASEYLLFEDAYYYLYLALQAYASLQTADSKELKQETESHSEWKCIQYRKRLALQKSFYRLIHRKKYL